MSNPKILLADDSVAMSKVIELRLIDEGFDVTYVGDGDRAMEKFVEIEPDCVIADINMPGMGGYQLCEMIKTDDATRDIPVILVVGSFEPFDAGEASRVGANYYFTKPYRSITDVIEKVADLIAAKDFSAVVAPETEDIEDLYAQSIVEVEDAPVEQEFERVFDDEDVTVGETTVEPTLELTDDDPGADIEAAIDELQNPGGEPAEAAFVVEEAVQAAITPLTRVFDEAAGDDHLIVETHLHKPTAELNVKNASVNGDDPFAAVADQTPLTTTPANANGVKFQFAESAETDADEHIWPPVDTNDTASFPPALIEQIANRVLERLSDKAVRDAAKEAVPRIAEKLIREALEEETGQ